MNKVIAKIEEIRKKKGITKTHVATYCGHTVAWYYDISKGRRRVYLDDALMILESIDEEPGIFFRNKLSDTLNLDERTA